MSTASLLVEINPKVRDHLDHLKLHPEESYSDVIDRLAIIALYEEPLDPETQEKIAQALKDLKEGRSFTSQEISKMLDCFHLSYDFVPSLFLPESRSRFVSMKWTPSERASVPVGEHEGQTAEHKSG